MSGGVRAAGAMGLVVAALAVAGLGCSGHGHGVGGSGGDMAVAVPPPDFAVPPVCSPVDTIVDPSCPADGGACPPNTIGTTLFSSCQCYRVCTVDTQCPCDRKCDALLNKDGSLAGHACLPGNSVGTRCGQDAATKNYFGSGFCAQALQCIAADSAKLFRYCTPECNTQADCPAQTTCLPTFDSSGNPTGNVCAYDSNDKGDKNLGQTCVVGIDTCKTGQLCDDVCRAQCDGPGASCASGSCTALLDPSHGNAIIGYVCK